MQRSTHFQSALEALALRAGYVREMEPHDDAVADVRLKLEAEFQQLARENSFVGEQARRMASSAKAFEAESAARAAAEDDAPRDGDIEGGAQLKRRRSDSESLGSKSRASRSENESEDEDEDDSDNDNDSGSDGGSDEEDSEEEKEEEEKREEEEGKGVSQGIRDVKREEKSKAVASDRDRALWQARIEADARRSEAAEGMRRLRETRRLEAGLGPREYSTNPRAIREREARAALQRAQERGEK